MKFLWLLVPFVSAQDESFNTNGQTQAMDSLHLLQKHSQKIVLVQKPPEELGANTRCKEKSKQIFAVDCSTLQQGVQSKCQNAALSKEACISRCDADPDCRSVGYWPANLNKGSNRAKLCIQWRSVCNTKRDLPDDGGQNVLVRVFKADEEDDEVVEPVDPTTTTPPCDPAVDDFCGWRHADDNNTCDVDGCGNRAEFRKKFAELPPVEAPVNAEPDDIIAEAGGPPPPGKQFHNLHFKKVGDNDLGGGGIRYVDVTHLEVDGVDRAIDCIVTASGYKGFKPAKNGLAPGGSIAQINIMHSTSVDFTFSFVFQDTGAPATLGEFFWSVFDLDTGKGFKRKGKPVQAVETVSVGGYKEYYLIPQDKDGEISTVPGATGTTFAGTTWGKESDNPADPLVLNDVQAARSVSFKFAAGRSSFTATYAVGKAVRGGRNFMFSGMTNLYFCKAPKVNLDFSLATVARNNLGGKGPQNKSGEPEGILYQNIASVDGQTIDLEVNALQPYHPYNEEKNGLNGKFAQINLGTPSHESSGSCEFKFSLLKGGSDEPYEAEWLYFSMFDLDQAKSNKKWTPKWQESLTVSGFASQYISGDTEIKVEQLDKKTFRYNSSVKGTGKDNPKDPLELDAVMLRRTVTFVYRAVSELTATFAIGEPLAVNGRNFLVAGKSSTVSCDKNTYGDVINVQNHVTPPP